MAASALAMPLMNGSMPMNPVSVCFGLSDQMFAAAEAAFEAHVVGAVEQRAQVGGHRCGEIDRELRRQRVEQRAWRRLQRMALAPAEESATSLFRLIVHAGDLSEGLKTAMPGGMPGIARNE